MKKTTLSSFKKVSAEAPKHPTFNYPNTEEVDQVIELDGEIKEKIAIFKASSDAIKTAARAHWLSAFAGVADAPSSMLVPNSDGSKNIMVTVQNKYSDVPTETLEQVLTKKEIQDYFEATWELKIKSSVIPEKRRQEFVDKLSAVVESMGLNPGDIVEAKEAVKPKPNFHESRLTKLSKQVNERLDAVYSPTTALKVDGVK